MSDVIKTPTFRCNFPAILEPKDDLNGKPKYSVVGLFPKNADLTELKKAAQAAVVKKWGPDKVKWPKNLKSPFRDQGDKAKLVDGKEILPAGHEKGAVFIDFKTAYKPGAVDAKLHPIMDASEIYSGCYARVSTTAYAYEVRGNAGVAFGLNNFQKVSDGDPLSSKVRPEVEFEAVASDDSDDESGEISGTSQDDIFG